MCFRDKANATTNSQGCDIAYCFVQMGRIFLTLNTIDVL